MNRRTLIKSAAATAGVFKMPGIIRSARGATSGNRGVWGASFDGNTVLRNDGTIDNFPASSPYLLINYFYYGSSSLISRAGAGKLWTVLAQESSAATPGPPLTIWHWWGGIKNASPVIYYGISTSGSPPVGNLGYNTAGTVPYDNKWHNVLLYWDLTKSGFNVLQCYVDDVLTGNSGCASGTMVYQNWSGTQLHWSIGGELQVANRFVGNLAELYLYAGTSFDPSNPNLRAGFYDASTGQPPIFDHLVPDGSAAIPGVLPNIYLSGPGGLFWSNGKRKASVDYGGGNIRSVIDTDDVNSFFVASGQLGSPSTDPWGTVGV